MKRIILIVCLAALTLFGARAGNSIDVDVAKPSGIENEEAADILQDNIRQALSLNDINVADSKYVIYSDVALLSKSVTSTTPSKNVIELSITLTFKDKSSGSAIESVTFSVKGIGNDDNQAYLAAIKNVQPRNSKLKTLIVNAKTKIEH